MYVIVVTVDFWSKAGLPEPKNRFLGFLPQGICEKNLDWGLQLKDTF